MSDLWFLGNEDMWATGGWTSPDPVLQGNSSWTWDVEFSTSPSQWTYARSSINSFLDLGDGYVFSGIVSYRTRNADGSDTDHPIGQGTQNGVADFMNDMAVDDVTFGFGIGSNGDIFMANINMEIWVTG
ncbi:MAG TPA: hypothetical protein VJR23_10375 [Candidatus Acidoferrales bacterium]|nr:hypothetical protein [Candidatus Acidoferrales bacterium]